jgi:hypothetical protein
MMLIEGKSEAQRVAAVKPLNKSIAPCKFMAKGYNPPESLRPIAASGPAKSLMRGGIVDLRANARNSKELPAEDRVVSTK